MRDYLKIKLTQEYNCLLTKGTFCAFLNQTIKNSCVKSIESLVDFYLIVLRYPCEDKIE